MTSQGFNDVTICSLLSTKRQLNSYIFKLQMRSVIFYHSPLGEAYEMTLDT